MDPKLDSKAGRVARKAGLVACKSRHSYSIDYQGGFRLVDPYTNAVVSVERFDMSSEDVFVFCKPELRRVIRRLTASKAKLQKRKWELLARLQKAISDFNAGLISKSELRRQVPKPYTAPIRSPKPPPVLRSVSPQNLRLDAHSKRLSYFYDR